MTGADADNEIHSGTRSYRPDIDGLRAVAVFAVILYHLGVGGFSGGFVGVDVFFVISGFLITGLIRDEVVSSGEFRFGSFYLRRIRRLFPALGFTLVASFMAAAILFPPEPFKSFAGSFVAAIFSFSNVWFWNEAGYFDTSAITKPLLHTWSLSVEEQFYFVWPALLFVLLKVSRGSPPLWGLFILGTISLLWNIDLAHFDSAATKFFSPPLARVMSDDRSSIFYLPVFRIFEFAIGAVLNWTPRRLLRSGWTAEISVLAGISLIGASVVLFTSQEAFPTWRALIPCIGAALLVQSGDVSKLGGFLRSGPVVWAGRISYSLYLIHWPVIVFYLYWRNASVPTPLEQAGLFSVSLVCAALMYQFIEQPFRKPGNTPAANRKFAGAAATFASLLVASGAGVFLTEGAAWRYAPEVARLQQPVPPPRQDYACFMGPSLSYRDIDERCYQIDTASPKKSILVFGDSTAEHLVSGLREVLGARYQVLQYASSSCASVLGYSEPDSPYCAENNEKFLTAIVAQNKYDLVLISNTSRWEALVAGFPETARRLDAEGIKYVMIGQIPFFEDLPANIIARRADGTNIPTALREGLSFGCDGDEHGVDKLVPPDDFFSMNALLCNGPDPVYEIGGQPIHKDHIHLNPWGSAQVVEAIAAWLDEKDHLP